jgi:RimJ/RimL family protein N-acetyltransferase
MAKVFETERLIIRPFTLDDLEEIHRILDVELNWAGRLLTLEERKQRLQGWMAADELEVPCGWRAVIRKEDDRLMGEVRLNVEVLTADVRSLFPSAGERDNSPFSTLEYYLGYAFSAAYWGKGYATEAARRMVEYAFTEKKLPRVLAETGEENVRSQNLMRRLGLQLVRAPRPGWPQRIVAMLQNPAIG